MSDAEVGEGAGLSTVAWQRLTLVLGLPLKFEIGRDSLEEPADAGHLGIQELVLRLGRRVGYPGTFELATKPADPTRSTDVGLTDDINRRLLQIECVNTFGNIGASVRSSDRKRAEADQLAVAKGGARPYSVHLCWVVRASKRNRQLLAKYPELFGTRFPGSSRAWVDALNTGSPPPGQAGLIWCNVACTRIFAWRQRAARG